MSVQVLYHFDQVENSGKIIDADHWQRAHTLLEMTLQLHPDNSRYQEYAEYFYELAGEQPDTIRKDLWDASMEKALDYARLCTLMRPSWSEFWVVLNRVKIKLKQFDIEQVGAMAMASEFGPWESALQMDIARSGLGEWDNLSIEGRRWTLLTLEKTLEMKSYYPPKINELLNHTNFNTLCASSQSLGDLKLVALAEACQKRESTNAFSK